MGIHELCLYYTRFHFSFKTLNKNKIGLTTVNELLCDLYIQLLGSRKSVYFLIRRGRTT